MKWGKGKKKDGKVFGVPLLEAVCMNRSADAHSPLPSVCTDVISYLEKHGKLMLTNFCLLFD